MAKKAIKTIVANRIQLNDLKGKPRIILDASGDKAAYIHILDAAQTTSVALTVHLEANESSIEIQNQVGLHGGGEGTGTLAILDGKGHLKIAMFCQPMTNEPVIRVYDKGRSREI